MARRDIERRFRQLAADRWDAVQRGHYLTCDIDSEYKRYMHVVGMTPAAASRDGDADWFRWKAYSNRNSKPE